MKHVEIYIDEYLKGELPRSDTERVAAHLATCPGCREYADWLGRLEGMAGVARLEPPESMVQELEACLLAIPDQVEAGEPEARPGRTRVEPLFRTPSWLAYPAPLIRTAAVLLLGVLAGFGLRGTPGRQAIGPQPAEMEESLAMRSGALKAAGPAAIGMAPGETSVDELEERVAALERALVANHLARVEMTVLHFVSGTNEGNLTPIPPEASRNLLSVTSNLKANYKEAGDETMAALFGKIEIVLNEIERISSARDMKSARFVASIIEEQGLLSTLQRIKVGLEE